MNDHKGFCATSHGPRATNNTNNSSASPLFDKRQSSKENIRIPEHPPSPESPENKTTTLRDFRDLKVWQMAKELAVDIYKITKQFPQDEIYGLSSQMRRAGVSISSNIAEGFNRFYKKDYRRFLMIALGSCGELESQIEVGVALGYVPQNASMDLLEKLNHENRMLRRLHSAMDEKKRFAEGVPRFTTQKNSPPEGQRVNPL